TMRPKNNVLLTATQRRIVNTQTMMNVRLTFNLRSHSCSHLNNITSAATTNLDRRKMLIEKHRLNKLHLQHTSEKSTITSFLCLPGNNTGLLNTHTTSILTGHGPTRQYFSRFQ